MMRRVVRAIEVRASCGTISGPASAAVRRQSVTPPERRLLHPYDTMLTGTAANSFEEYYQSWRQNPQSVDESFDRLFRSIDAKVNEPNQPIFEQPLRVLTVGGLQAQSLQDSGRLSWMIQSFEHRGHLVASLDPLNYTDDPNQRIPSRKMSESVRLDVEFFGFQQTDMQKVFNVGFHASVGGILSPDTPSMTLKQLHERLVRTYCGNIGWDYSHVESAEVNRWLRDHIETPERFVDSALRELSREEKLRVLKDVAAGVKFEQFFNKKFYMQKRFGLDGGESLIPGLEALIERATGHGVDEVVIGMPHRGRLSTLHNIAGKPFPAIVKEFSGLKAEDFKGVEGSGDVKYHLGWRTTRTLRNGKQVLVELMPNPSHLECVNPTVQGRSRAAQVFRGDSGGKRVLPIEIHGDAAFAGQGVAFETMGLSELSSYHTGGTVHVVVNNQIGFTTDPKSSRSSEHCTDLGRVFHCPVFHVNGDSPEDVVRVFKLAADYRATFGRSVVIDLVCYRRFGHNESDDPTVTQPLMYARIANRKDLFSVFRDSLVARNVVTSDEADAVGNASLAEYGAKFDEAKTLEYPPVLTTRPPQWEALRSYHAPRSFEPTSLPPEFITPIVAALSVAKLPPTFKVHKVLEGILQRRHKAVSGQEGLDFGAAEALAFGTLLQEGYHVRISGQDVQRGTFSHRHSVIHDQVTDETYTPLANISPTQGKLVIQNSSLSEFGVLGFETGYSTYHPKSFVMWEAQFGDFANGAQIVFDNFIAAGEAKWQVEYAPVVSMPHGYDGNGPEHSSGRIERFLQLSDDDEDVIQRDLIARASRCNIEVMYPSTPAQYYHLIRRHVHRNFRKPIINFFSKAFLRAPNLSNLDECLSGSFRTVIGDTTVSAKDANVIILTTGQMYHYLAEERQRLGANNVAIIRVEQLAPFPSVEIESCLKEYPRDASLRWVQEEPLNMGAWSFAEPRLATILKSLGSQQSFEYVGRKIAASPATGFKKAHDYEQKKILAEAFRNP